MRGRVIGNYTTGAPVAIDCASFDQSMARRLKKLLVANRGEIALRIIRSARVFGLKTVAVYSAADAKSAHVVAADEAILDRTGRGREELSQHRGDNREPQNNPAPTRFILATDFCPSVPSSRSAAADAQDRFSSDRGRDVMAALGDKVAARRIAVAAGVPVVPGIETAEISAARDFAAQVGYPILIKAAAGGGGRGMRVVAEAAQLEALSKRRRARLRRLSATVGYSSRSISRIRGISKFRFSATNTATSSHLASAIAQSSGGIRKLSRSRRRRVSPTEMRAKMIDAALKLARAAHYTQRRHRRVPGRGRQFLLPRSQRAPASRASRDRDAFRMRPGMRATARRRGRQSLGASGAARRSDRMPHQRRGSRA